LQIKRSCIASNFIVLVLSQAVLSPPRRTVLVLEALWYSKPAHWSAGYRVTPRSTIDIVAVQKAIEYEYEYEYEHEHEHCGASKSPLVLS